MRYGCVSPTPEMEDLDHSDSESSDASFEIVSAEGIDDSQTATPSFKPCVRFHDIFDVYPMDADVVARVSSSGDFKMSSGDKVVVVPLAWSSVDQAVCVSKLNGCYVRFDVNELPKAPADQFYQLCYCTAEGSIVGVSTPFFFREVHEEDLMEFQKEQNKEFWTFRSRFAVLTDLYWNAVKNNGATHPDEMTGSCGAKKDSNMTEKSSVESCGASKDAKSIDEPIGELVSWTEVCDLINKSIAVDGGANEASEVTPEPSTENRSVNNVSEVKEESPAENCSEIKDPEPTEKTPAETKSEDPVQPELPSFSQALTTDDLKTDSSKNEPNNTAELKESEPVAKPMANSTPQKSDDGPAERIMEVGPWKLVVNDSFYDRAQYAERIKKLAGTTSSCTWANRVPTLETKVQNLKLWDDYSRRVSQFQRRFSDYNPYKGVTLMRLATFKALPESIVGKLVLEAMQNTPPDQLERDQLLCEARRQSRYDEFIRRNNGIVRTHAPTHPKESAGPVSQTILSLTSRIETQAVLMRDLKLQLANESKTIETLKVEYLTYKRDMETRLKHCAKIYAKMSLKLRQLTSEGRKKA